MTDRVLVIGACGQLGVELTLALRKSYGVDGVVATDVVDARPELKDGPFEYLDVLDPQVLGNLLRKYNITQVYLLAALLSATGEKNPKFAWRLNMEGLLNVLEAAREQKLHKIYWPSSIAVFGPHTPEDQTPQHTIMDPNTVYGISKLAGERWCEYYHSKYGVDVRSLRYPGLVGYKALPGGGTTDYAVDIFHKALQGKTYECFLRSNTFLPMMYMPDAIRSTIELMEAPADDIHVRSSYNIGAFSVSPEELAGAIRRHVPDFRIVYKPDFRQQIADSWPKSIDDLAAREDWGWRPDYDLDRMTADMLLNLEPLLKAAAASS